MKKKTISKITNKVKQALKKKEYIILSTSLGDTWSAKEANPKHNSGGFIIRWVCKDIGFGELTFYVDKKGKLFCETECMSRAFVDKVVEHFMNSVNFLDK